MDDQPARLRDLARVFLKIGAMSYGGPAIMGIMQNEIQERRRWLGKERFVEGLSIVNMLPGPGATQLAIFIGHTKGGLAGGIVAGVCFIIPAFAIMLLLASAYGAFGALPAMRNAFYGIGPVVVGIFAVAIYRLAKGTIKDRLQIPIAVAAVGLMLFSPFGLAVIAAGGRLRRRGAVPFLAHGLGGSPDAWSSPWPALMPPRDLLSVRGCPLRVPGPRSAVGPRDALGRRRLLLQGRHLHVRRRSFDARLHAGAGRRPIRLADAAGVRRRPGAGSADAGAGPDAGGLHRLQAVRGLSGRQSRPVRSFCRRS